MLSYHPLLVFETVEEARVDSLLGEVAAELEMPLFEWTVTRGLLRPPSTQPVHGTQDALGLLRHLEGMTAEAVFHAKDLLPHLDDPSVARALREVVDKFTQTRATLVVSGITGKLPPQLESISVHASLDLPAETELREMMRTVLADLRRAQPIDVALEPAELQPVLNALRGMTLNQARQALAHAILEDRVLDAGDVARILERKAQALRDDGLLEFYPAGDNAFELGGFGRLKSWLERAAVGFTPAAVDLNLSPPRGLLLVGVQGCGKSLACKFIARKWQMPLLKLEAGRLYDKYVGESEKNFRRATSLAESMAPAVLWIDEIEKGFGPGGDSEGDGGVSRRLFGSFLTWLQEKRADVFVVATANDVFALPPELLRKGRFDEIFFVDLPDAEERREIFRIHLALRKQDPSATDLAPLVAASEGFSGAEIEQAVIAGLYRALHAGVPLDSALLQAELSETRPLSVTRREDVDRLRSLASERFVPVR